jgi:phage terminase large subunit-like protein
VLTGLRELLYVLRGNATDFAFIEREILDLAGRFDIREIGYDRTFAGEIVTKLQDKGLELIQFGQGFLSLALRLPNWSAS